MQLIDFWKDNPSIQQFITKLKPQTWQMVTGLLASSKALFLANLVDQTQQPILVVEPDPYQAQRLFEDLGQFLSKEQVHSFPVADSLATQQAISSPESLDQRLQTLDFLLSQKPGVVVSAGVGVTYPLPSPQQFQESSLTLAVDQEWDQETLSRRLVAAGYRRENLVTHPGEFALRGDILDLYAPLAATAWRCEFFGDTIESLHELDPATQRNQAAVSEVHLIPATDRFASEKQYQAVGIKIQKDLDQQLVHLKQTEDQKKLRQSFVDDLTELAAGRPGPHLESYINYLYSSKQTLSSYLPSTGAIVYDDWDRIAAQAQTTMTENLTWWQEQLNQGRVLKTTLPTDRFSKHWQQVDVAQIELTVFARQRRHLDQLLSLTTRSVQQFYSNLPALKMELERWQHQEVTVVLFLSDATRLQKFTQTLADFAISAPTRTLNDLEPGKVQLVEGNLQSGIEFPNAKLVLLTERELFNRPPHARPPRTQLTNAQRLKSYTDLKPGDYVVHLNHGIGRFEGLQTLTVDGKHNDYLTLTYRDDGQILVPVNQLNLVQKYVASEGKKPRLNKLGGQEWHKTKQKVQQNIEDIADDLIALSAQRAAELGFAFPPDDDLQTKFEDQFPYIETPDQLRSVAEIKQDMQQPHPMDRLLVGDVGFGKTEVALRAAFKAIMGGKQVAFLVPTTILAQQHYQTIQARFQGFPVKFAVLSRFQTRAQQTQIKVDLAAGRLDLVVGTHRLLSKDIKFLDLGLLIVDEEQRFGVKHKERLKQLKSQIDVLTMTATPIPRTLNMSLNGVRQLSVIETPPPNRYPIQTLVLEQNYDIIQSAIHRELARHGQVFYLHNRVEDMAKVAQLLQGLVPEARVGIVNGQMTQIQLEQVMSDFLEGLYDVLVTTTIIETGVDLPNANTLIVENADHYGLSQLYQLRGRVGRSSRLAYAYFMYRPDKNLTEVSEKRLAALKDFTELGSGFKIAMRDLSIRGAGDLLGKQQHGFINSVGYDLYTQMLQEAVTKRQGKQAKSLTTDAELKLAVEAYLPDDYISDSRQKIEIYKRLRLVGDLEHLEQLRQEVRERFGTYPEVVANLFQMTQLKLVADQALVEQINQHPQGVLVRFAPQAQKYLSGEKIFQLLAQVTLKARVANEHQQFQVTFQLPAAEDQLLPELFKFVTACAQAAQGSK
ncbi:transcription-repair coupling factor [Lactobacillus sp. DCY120]|uniref:Transcription-repair-coupling factor n=1 Tax=Bombilactobacillus apium TaxID=2675299 RepID=A0A850R6P3_9LACO|nr:transcription-repair coupling factor [Bombilactobacillus apium]NVY96312.1 transcription-repair coupling factor [Bombilactobacillus apium]